jgi:flavodoxin I
MAKLVIIYGTGFGNTGIMAQAIEEGAKNAGLDVISKKVEEATPADIENADAIAIGSATYRGAAMPSVIKYVEEMGKTSLQGKLGTSFGSYGWSGEAAGVIGKKLKDYKMEVLEPPLRIKRKPSTEGIEECKNLGAMIAEKLK